MERTNNQPAKLLVHIERARLVRASWRGSGGLEEVLPCGALATSRAASTDDVEEATCEACKRAEGEVRA